MKAARAASLFALPLALIACTDEPLGPSPGEPAPPSCADDPSTCWRGVHGTARLGEDARVPGWSTVDLGSGTLYYGQNLPEKQRGYIYTSPDFTNPTLRVGNVAQNVCEPLIDAVGYEGPTSVRQLALMSNVSFDASERPVLFGTEESECYRGLLTFRPDDQYGVIRFIHMDLNGVVDIEYWIGDPGVIDFRNAPELPR
jgi:hypothetical protein